MNSEKFFVLVFIHQKKSEFLNVLLEMFCWSISLIITLQYLKNVFQFLQKSVFSIFRYPDDQEDFFNSRLPGEFDEQKAGKRIKLSIPVTWETQISK